MVHCFGCSLDGVLAFSDLHRTMSESLMYQLIQCYFSNVVLHFAWNIGTCHSTNTSGLLLSSYRKMSVYMYLIFQHQYQVQRDRKMSEIWRKQFSRPKPMYVVQHILVCVLSIGFCRLYSFRVNVYRFLFWTDGKRCKSLLSSKSILPCLIYCYITL